MKRTSDSLAGAHKIPKTSDNSTSTGSHMKRMRRDGSLRPKLLRRGASHASSAQEFMKSEWTCDELDLNKQISSLSELVSDKFKLVEELFSIFSILELKEFTPDILKEYSVNQLKEICLEELNTISNAKIKFMTEGNDPEDYVEPETNVEDKDIGDTSDGIQLSVDDNEYSDFLGAENLEPRKLKKEMKDAEVQANWSSLESSSSDDSHSEHKDDEGWMNLWKLEQMEILELEMRARAIRMLLKQQEEEDEGGPSQPCSQETIKVTDENESIIDSNVLTKETNESIEKQWQQNDENSDSEDGEIPDTEDNYQHKELKIKSSEDSNIEKNDNKSVNNLDQNEELDEENENTFKVQSNEDIVRNEDNNQESNIDKSDDNIQSEYEINQKTESEEKSKQEGEDHKLNDKPEECYSHKEDIILVNEEFDEELEEENTEEKDEDSDQISDKKSIVSEKSDENSENQNIEVCEPEVDTNCSDSSNH